MRKQYVAALCGLVVMVVQLSGCAVGRPINASTELSKHNSMKKVAVLGSSRVVWPRMFGKEPVLGLEASKETLNAVLPMFSTHIRAKGYELTAVEPVGIYPYPHYTEDWVFPANGEYQDPEEDKEGKSTAKTQTGTSTGVNSNDFGKPYKLADKKAAFVYPRFAQNAIAHTAARTVFDHIDQQLGVAPLAPGAVGNAAGEITTQPPTEALNLLREETGADTLCFAHVQGHRFTAARKAGALAMNLVTAMFGVVTIPPQDAAAVSLTCYSTDSTGLAWQSVFQHVGDPEKPNTNAVKELLHYFPHHGEPLSPSCAPDGKKPMLYLCKQEKESNRG